MSCLWVSIILLAIFGIVITRFVQSQRRSTAWNRVYSAVARRLNGRLRPAGSFSYPLIRVPHGFGVLQVGPTTSREGDCMQAVVERWDSAARTEIATEGLIGAVRQRHRFELPRPDVLTNEWHVFGSNGPFAQQLLTSGVTWQLERLRCLAEPHELYVVWERGRLTVRRLGFLREAVQLEEFIRAVLVLFDQSNLSLEEGIEFVNPAEAQLLEDPICKVCGDRIGGDLVLCTRCRTPHCQECWEFTGACSTFACGETRFVRPQIAQPIVHPDNEQSQSQSQQ